MKKLLYILTGALLLAGVFIGCEKPEKESENGKEQTDLQILDENDQEISVLDLGEARQGVFKIKNTGSSIVEWEIPTLAEKWLFCSKQSDKLASGASERIDLTLDWSKMAKGENAAVVYIGSTVGTMQLTVRAVRAEKEVETAFGMNLEMVYVEGGTFSMGTTAEQDSDAESDEKPIHSVTLDNFYIGKYEVTQAQWKAVMKTEPSEFKGDNLPVEQVSWHDAQEFCKKLSEQTGKNYRLPTEAEWEYAARGGQRADGTKYAGSNTIGDVAWYTSNSNKGTHPVGQKQPNGLGLYDMSGNVYEWCLDWYGSDYYSSSPAINPQGPASGSERVLRGGSWFCNADACRVSNRGSGNPGNHSINLGFRVVCLP